MWYMSIDDEGRPIGWDTKLWANAFPVTDSIRAIHEQHPDYIWDNIEKTLVAPPVYEPSPEELAATIEEKKFALWNACSEYEKSFISGVGLSILALGVAKGKPKALAVAAWSQNLWGNSLDNSGVYYGRKAQITATSELNLDFSEAGSMPYSVSELAVEAMS